jgi:uncharacterized protein YraI
MKNQLRFLFGSMLLMWLAAGCTAGIGQGPTAWIDQPLEKDNPRALAPVYITAHASSDSGVARFDFYIDEKPLVSVSAANCALCDASAQWDPPAAGIYHVRVQAVDGNGNKGDFAQSIVRISGEALAQEDTITPTPHELIEMIPEKATWTPTPAIQTITTITTTAPTGLTIQAGSNANCRSGPGTVYDIDDGLRKGVTASIEGRSQDNQWVWIPKPSGGSGHCWVAANVGPINGDLTKVAVVYAPPAPQIITITVPAPQIITPIPIQVDSTPPDISVSVTNSTINTCTASCCPDPSTTSVQALVSDAESGVGPVTVHWSINGVESSAPMSPAGGGVYTTTLGPFTDVGSISIWVEARDNTGNSGTGNLSGPVTIQSPIC